MEEMKKEIACLNSLCEERYQAIVRKETELQDTKAAFNKKLIEERGSGKDENRRLRSELYAKEKEVYGLNNENMLAITNVRKHQRIIDSMRLMAEPTLVEISDLREWKQQTLVAMDEQTVELEKVKIERTHLSSQCEEQQERVCDTESKLREREELFKNKLADLKKWKQQARNAIKDSISGKDDMAEQIDELALRKEEALLTMDRSNKENLASAQRIDDLENELKYYLKKYKESMKALALMEKALMTVETHRNMLMQNGCDAPRFPTQRARQ